MCHHPHEVPKSLQTPELKRLQEKLDRRNFLVKTSLGLGALAVGNLLGCQKSSPEISGNDDAANSEESVLKALPHLAPRAKWVIYLVMAGGTSQFETSDYTPHMVHLFGQELPGSVRQSQWL